MRKRTIERLVDLEGKAAAPGFAEQQRQRQIDLMTDEERADLVQRRFESVFAGADDWRSNAIRRILTIGELEKTLEHLAANDAGELGDWIRQKMASNPAGFLFRIGATIHSDYRPNGWRDDAEYEFYTRQIADLAWRIVLENQEKVTHEHSI